MKTYVYTKKGEERAKELGLEERKEGTEATCGYKPLSELTGRGSIAEAWLEAGYVREVIKNETDC